MMIAVAGPALHSALISPFLLILLHLRARQERHGFIFIVCATGKSAAEMLAILQGRVGNATPAEIENAAGEQRKITAIRINKWLAELSPGGGAEGPRGPSGTAAAKM